MSEAAQVARTDNDETGTFDANDVVDVTDATDSADAADVAGADGSARTDGVEVTVRYWAAARAATGVDSERLTGRTVGEVLDTAVERHPGLAPVSRVATFLLDGRSAARENDLISSATLEVLPPFAGG